MNDATEREERGIRFISDFARRYENFWNVWINRLAKILPRTRHFRRSRAQVILALVMFFESTASGVFVAAAVAYCSVRAVREVAHWLVYG